jgi:hypothetical protein
MTITNAIRKLCLDCAGNAYGVKHCDGNKIFVNEKTFYPRCPFYLYRLKKGKPSETAIRRYCHRCMGYIKILARKCQSISCPIKKISEPKKIKRNEDSKLLRLKTSHFNDYPVNDYKTM